MRNGLMALLASNRGAGQFRAESTAADEATIWLYDVIVRDDYWGGVSALTLGKALADHRDKSVIHLRIDSPGGDVFAGRAVEQLIAEHPGRVIAHIDGFAASAASFVALAAAERHISHGGMFMLHKSWTVSWGNADELRATCDLLDKIDESLVATYALRTGQDADTLRNWMAAETWFDAAESLAAGLATTIAGVEPGEDEEHLGSGDDGAAGAAALWDMRAYSCPPPVARRRQLPNARAAAPVQTAPTITQFDRAAALRRLAVAQL